VIVTATAGLLLVGSAGLRAAEAQDPPGPTGPPTTGPATTEPPTTIPATTAPPTTAPATTQVTTAPPSTTVAGGGGVVATSRPGADATSPSLAPGHAVPAESPAPQASAPSVAASGPAATGSTGLSQGGGPAPAAARSSSPRKVLRELLRDGPAQLPQRVVEEATIALRRLSPAELALFALLTLFSLALTGIAGTTLWWTLHAWWTPQTLAATGFSGASGDPRLSFSLIVPARHEQAVLGATLSRLAAIDHPAFEVLVVVGDDDAETAAVAQRAAKRHPDQVRVVLDTSRPKNKPKALNRALPACRGDVVGVFDAEDEVHPQLLRHVDARFAETGADVVQGGVQLMNYHSNWYSVRNVLE
jgi:Glycosyltransferase like family 2